MELAWDHCDDPEALMSGSCQVLARVVFLGKLATKIEELKDLLDVVPALARRTDQLCSPPALTRLSAFRSTLSQDQICRLLEQPMGFLELPEELLDAVVMETLHDGARASDVPILKTLRQVCQRLYESHAIMTNLFSRIRMIADEDYLFTADELKRSGIAGYVNHVTFVQPLHVQRTFGDFVESFESLASSIYQPNRHVCRGDPIECWRRHQQQVEETNL